MIHMQANRGWDPGRLKGIEIALCRPGPPAGPGALEDWEEPHTDAGPGLRQLLHKSHHVS